MKKITTAIALCALICSCSKNKTNPSNKASFTYNQILDSMGIMPGSSYYYRTIASNDIITFNANQTITEKTSKTSVTIKVIYWDTLIPVATNSGFRCKLSATSNISLEGDTLTGNFLNDNKLNFISDMGSGEFMRSFYGKISTDTIFYSSYLYLTL